MTKRKGRSHRRVMAGRAQREGPVPAGPSNNRPPSGFSAERIGNPAGLQGDKPENPPSTRKSQTITREVRAALHRAIRAGRPRLAAGLAAALARHEKKRGAAA
jgi:hypothetical protein